MNRFIRLLCGLGVITHALTVHASCTAIPGAGQIWQRESVHWVFVGELHGSNETPAAFFELVCDALKHRKHIIVALERPDSEQAVLEDILAGPNLSAATELLLTQPGWKDGMDGRASAAMLRLLLSLRELRKNCKDLEIFAFDIPFTGTSPGARDKAMGQALLTLRARRRDAVILVLTGNLHAMLAPLNHYNFAAMYLPRNEALSLEVTDRGGETWSMINGACGPSVGGVGDKGVRKPPGIYLDPALAPFGKVDGILALGVPLTASPPASRVPHCSSECRSKFLAAHPPE